PVNLTDIFLMKSDGTEQTFLTRGGTASWSPNGKLIAFQRSASGCADCLPIDEGAGDPTKDSDIFVMAAHPGARPTNITNTPNLIERYPNWSRDGQWIVYAGKVPDQPTYDIYKLKVNPDGTPVQGPDNPRRLTNADSELDRNPSWSPDGTKIVFLCRNFLS